MQSALLCLLLLLGPAAPSAILPSALQEQQQLLKDVQQQRWSGAQAAGKSTRYQPTDAELRLATLSAALLSQLPAQPDNPQAAQHVRQLRRYITQVSRSKVELDDALSKSGNDAFATSAVLTAFQKYLSDQESMAKSLGLQSAEVLAWSPFALQSGDLRSQLETLWSRTSPLVTDLAIYLKSRQPLDSARQAQLVMACAASGRCEELVKMALPYPDTSNAVADLLRQKKLGAEQLAQLADSFLQRLGLPAAPTQLWQSSSFSDLDSGCSAYADAEKVRLCAPGNLTGLRAALEVMTDSAYWRAAASSQEAPLQDEPFPGFRRAVSACVELLALQPQSAQQLVYGYHTHQAEAQPVSLYLAQSVRNAGRPDSVCSGDLGCQMTANWLMETAVTQLLPMAYHVASLHWLQEAASSPAPFAAWRRHMQHTLGVTVTAAPAEVDASFYSTDGHISAVLATFAAFQLHEAACPTGAACAIKPRAGNVIKSVMRAGASQPWQTLLGSVSGTAAPTAAPLVAFFGPLKLLTAPAVNPASLRTMELDDEEEESRRSAKEAARVRALSDACSKVASKTAAETILCNWNTDADKTVTDVKEDAWNMGGDVTNKNDTKLVHDKVDYLSKKGGARAALLKITQDKWIKDNKSQDELSLWGQMMILAEKDVAQADEGLLNDLLNETTMMYTNYISLMVCPYDNQDCKDEEKWTLWDLQQAASDMAAHELSYYWQRYRSAAKEKLASHFSDYVKHGNDAATAAGLKHFGELWLEPYGLDDGYALLEALAGTWKDVDMLYKMLHTYVRFQMKAQYPDEGLGKDSPLPSHLLGDMFAENWLNIYNKTKFDDFDIDITDTLRNKKYTVTKMTQDAKNFFNGIGLQNFDSYPLFSENSDLTADSCMQDQDCEPLAWTDGKGDDIRLRMINTVDMDTYETVHNKMAALEYYVEYKDQDPLYRAAVNPAVTDAVAGALSLSVLNPKYLKNRGLISDYNETFYDNFLYRRALQYLVPMPFDFVTQTWRWEVFNGSIDSSNWEHRWWSLREDYQGVRPPVRRSSSDADPLAVPAVARDRPAFQRYMSTVLQFQLFEYLCVQAKQFDPSTKATMLAECDLSGLKDVGSQLKPLMAAGKTESWQNLLEKYTLTKNLSSSSMLRYFEPLKARLQSEIVSNDLESGWKSNLGDYWEEDDDDNTVPIVVGVVLGVFVLIVLVAYFVVRIRRSKEE